MATVKWNLVILLVFTGLIDAMGNGDTRIGTDYYGVLLGPLDGYRSLNPESSDAITADSIRGTLYSVDEKTIFVYKFFLEEYADNRYIRFYAVQLNINASAFQEDAVFDKKVVLTIGPERKTALLERGYGGENFLLNIPYGHKITEYDGIVMLRFSRQLTELVDIPHDLRPPRPYPLGEFGFESGNRIHGVHADAVALNSQQIGLFNFNYDGTSPTTTFWIGTGPRVDQTGVKVAGPDTDKNGWVPRYKNANITITLPDIYSVFDVGYLALWNELFILDLGHVFFNLTGKNIPPFFDNATFVAVPPFIPVNVIWLYNGFSFDKDYGVNARGVDTINTKQILIEEFSFNGGCKDAYFWVGAQGSTVENGQLPYVDEVNGFYRVQRLPSPNGDIDTPLLRYYKTNITLTVQGNLTLYDLDYFGLWCDSFEPPKAIASTSLFRLQDIKNVGYLQVYTGEESGQSKEELEKERVKNYVTKIWRNFFACFWIFCRD